MTAPRAVGLIGFGAIGQSIVAAWQREHLPDHRLVAVLCRPQQLAQARASLPGESVVTADADAFIAAAPRIVVEAAGHGAVIAHGEALLLRGADLMLLSVGSLADAALLERLEGAARAGGGRLIVPVGAIAGLDGLRALRQAGLRWVRYTSTKPPRAWLGTPAADRIDLLALTAPAVLFEGHARDAARLYPKNANLAAAVALAGLGFERTEVRLVADPAAAGNSGRIEAEGESSRLEVTVAGLSSGSNPKTSAITGMSVLAALRNQASTLCFG